MTNINEEQFKGLSKKEKEYALKILEEFAKQGKSDTYNDLVNADYNEVPVDIITFISNDNYLGQAWKDKQGNLKLYPFWQEQLKELFPDNLTTKYNHAIFSGARGLGKSEMMVTIGLYLMYRLMCLKDPHEYLHLKPTEKVAFAFMNITKILAEDIGIAKFQSTVQLSPWFMARGTMSGVTNKVWNPPDWINIIVGSQASHVIGQPIYFAGMDEISFIRNQDIDKQKKIATDMMDTALGGMKTRFIHNGKNPTLMILASSKRSEKSFLEEHVRKKLQEDRESALIVDKPVWEVKPPETYSGKTFNVAVGNRFLVSEIMPEEASEDDYIIRGYNVIKVPVEFKEDFKDDIDRALCDFAGISSSDLSKYISGFRVQATTSHDFQNPFQKDIIEVGNSPEDNVQYKDYFDLNKVPSHLKSRPLYIHLDMSISGDKTGIAGVWISGKKNSVENSAKELLYQVAFCVSIKAPKGYQVSFAKNREFVYWLKEQGFNVKGISTDTFQNAAIAQDFVSKGYNYQIISVDRVNKDRICEPYAFFKNCIYEQRITLLPSKLLTQELVGLERNGNTGKIDHPDGGTSGSKDMADAVCGSLWNASQHAEEYSYDFGEDLDVVRIANDVDELSLENKKQIVLDMEEELKKFSLFDNAFQQKQLQMSFGQSEMSPTGGYSYAQDGMLIW